MVEYDNEKTGCCCIVLRPNASLSTHQALTFYVGISVVSLLIAGLFVMLGLWVVLPFSGLELGALGYCLLLAMKKADAQEVIIITNNTLLVQRGTVRVEEEEKLQMGWVQVSLERPKYRGYPSSLTIRSHGKSIEIGRFLVESERKKLAKQLKKLL